MPNPFRKAKMTGDTHPPEVEPDLPPPPESAEDKPARGAGKGAAAQAQEGADRQSDGTRPAAGSDARGDGN